MEEAGGAQRIRWCWKETSVRMSLHDSSTVVGNPNDCWIAYGDEANQKLEDAAMEYTAGYGTSNCVPLPGYTVDFQAMKQRKDSTGYLRDIQRVVETVVWCWQETAGQWMDRHSKEEIVGDPKDCWIRYDVMSNNMLENAYTSYQQSLLSSDKQKKKLFARLKGSKTKKDHICELVGNRYYVDFQTMKQTKPDTGFVRSVKRLMEQTASPLILAPSIEVASLPPPLPPPMPPPAAPPRVQERDLAIILVHFNPQRYKRRTQLLHECLERLVKTRDFLRSQTGSHPNGPIILHIVTVEAVFDQDLPEIQPGQYPGTTCITRRTTRRRGVLWGKEQLINIGWRQLPSHVEKICWIDADIEFPMDDWPSRVYETLESGPRCSFGQMWETCALLGPDDTTVTRVVTGFASRYCNGETYTEQANSHGEYWHPGFAWMATRAALEATNGLVTRTLGSADRHMAMSFLGQATLTVPSRMHQNYRRQVLDWERAVQRHKIALLSVPRVRIKHHWHGSLAYRKYDQRWRILEDYEFDPLYHINVDDDTELEEWNEHCPGALVEAVVQYFVDRNEDSLQVESVDVEDSTAADSTAAAVAEPAATYQPPAAYGNEMQYNAGSTEPIMVQAIPVPMDGRGGGNTNSDGGYNAFSYYG